MAYKNPTLTEIFVELRTEPGRLGMPEILQIAPKLQSRLGLPMEWGQSVAPTMEVVPRIRCWSAERQELVQLAPDLIVVNRLQPYLGWDAFEGLFNWARAIVHEVTPALVPATIALSTVDAIRSPLTDFRVGRYLKCGGAYVPGWFEDAEENCDVNLGRGTLDANGRNRQASMSVRVGEDVAAIHLNFLLQERLAGSDDELAVLRRLHDESTAMFEEMISDGTRELMGGKV